MISQKAPFSTVLRDQQTLDQTTGNHGHLVLRILNAGNASKDSINKALRWAHPTLLVYVASLHPEHPGHNQFLL